MPADFDVCVIGAGPAGLGFARKWAETQPTERLLVVDAGPEAGDRFCTVQESRGCRKVHPCHIVSGIGGASGLAGGKLSEYPAGRGLSTVMGDEVERNLHQSMADLQQYVPLVIPQGDEQGLAATTRHYEELNYELRHYRANKYAQADLRTAWQTIAGEVRSLGGRVETGTRALKITKSAAGLDITLRSGLEDYVVSATSVVIATGRSGDDLVDEFAGEHPKHPLDVGLRIEFPAACWPALDAVHNDLKLHFGNARTFCTSKSGWISPYKFQDIMLLEGRTDSSKTSSWSNLAITIRTDLPAQELVASMRSAVLAQGPGSTIRQPLADYLAGRATSPSHAREPLASFSYWRWGDVNALFPQGIARELRDAVERFSRDVLPPAAAASAHVFGPEIDYYWATVPHRGVMPGVWSAGDVTGSYRGILQAYAAGSFLVPEIEQHVLAADSRRPSLPLDVFP